jgi:endonuclease III
MPCHDYIIHDTQRLPVILDVLETTYTEHPLGDLTGGNPFRTLIGCIISLRTKDEVTIPASERLFSVADSPQDLAQLPVEEIARLIFPAGFYRVKAETIRNICQALIDHHGGIVPNTIDELLTLKGVGRKTANLVVALGHGLPAICVDIHVHRICNRLGVLTSETPEGTEMALRETLPPTHWEKINWLLVTHGRQICKPIGARCDTCPVIGLCAQRDVKKRATPKRLP